MRWGVYWTSCIRESYSAVTYLSNSLDVTGTNAHALPHHSHFDINIKVAAGFCAVFGAPATVHHIIATPSSKYQSIFPPTKQKIFFEEVPTS